ncbi:MAG TPA: hypothetical protein DHW49_06830 [Anaerolineae bacterium]|nr:hypothetical protein [Anaerolineae bacterium]
MKRFWYPFLFTSILGILGGLSVSIDLEYFDIPLILLISFMGGFFVVITLNLLLLKKRLIADVDFKDKIVLTQEKISFSYGYDFRYLFPSLFMLFGLVVYAYIRISNSTNNYFSISIVYLIFLLIICAIEILKTKLYLTNNGVIFQSPLGKISASWKDLIGIMQLYRGDDVFVFQKLEYSNSIIESLYGDYISISAFERKWKEKEIGAVIKIIAPQLKFIEKDKK